MSDNTAFISGLAIVVMCLLGTYIISAVDSNNCFTACNHNINCIEVCKK